jgi:hypothetical protein
VKESFESIRDLPISPLRRVLIDQRGMHTVVPHPVHEIPQRCPTGRREQVAAVPQIVEVEAGRSDG